MDPKRKELIEEEKDKIKEMRGKGYVRYRGEWVSKEEREKLIRERRSGRKPLPPAKEETEQEEQK